MNTAQHSVLPYNEGHFKALMAKYKNLNTFEEVAEWDTLASAEVERMVSALQEADAELATLKRDLERVTREHEEKSFFARLFSSRKEEKELAHQIATCDSQKAALEALATQLQEAIDFTPNSAQEQKTLLQELKQRKKELQIEKREVNAEMKSIRTDARKQSANAGRIGIYYNSKSAAYERRNIRYQKEATLRPYEDAKAAIERQLTQIDRDILWAQKFTS